MARLGWLRKRSAPAHGAATHATIARAVHEIDAFMRDDVMTISSNRIAEGDTTVVHAGFLATPIKTIGTAALAYAFIFVAQSFTSHSHRSLHSVNCVAAMRRAPMTVRRRRDIPSGPRRLLCR